MVVRSPRCNCIGFSVWHWNSDVLHSECGAPSSSISRPTQIDGLLDQPIIEAVAWVTVKVAQLYSCTPNSVFHDVFDCGAANNKVYYSIGLAYQATQFTLVSQYADRILRVPSKHCQDDMCTVTCPSFCQSLFPKLQKPPSVAPDSTAAFPNARQVNYCEI